MTQSKSQSPKLKLTARRAVRFVLPLVVLGLIVHLVLPQLASLEHSYQVIKNLIIWAFILAFLAQVASYLGSGYLLTALAKLSASSLSILSGTIITLAGTSFGMVAGGMVGSSAAIYKWMKRKNVASAAATLAGTIPALFNNIVLLIVSLVGLAHLLIVHELTRLQGFSFAVILVLLLSLIVLLIWGLRKRESLILFAEKVGQRIANILRREYQPQNTENWLTSLFNAADTLLSGGWRGPLLGAVLNVAFDMLTLYLLFIAAGHRVSFGVLLTGYGLPLLLGKMAFFVPGGVGVIESTMTALYVSLGVSNSVTVVVVLAYRILSFWLPLMFGFPMVFLLQKNYSAQQNEKENVEV